MNSQPDPHFAITTRTLIRVAGQVQAEIEAEFSGTRLTLARAGLLAELRHGPVAFGELAEHLHCGRSNMTAMVDRCVRDGFVVRVRDELDRRVTRAQLTDAGRLAAHQAMNVLHTYDEKLCERLGADAGALVRALTKI